MNELYSTTIEFIVKNSSQQEGVINNPSATGDFALPYLIAIIALIMISAIGIILVLAKQKGFLLNNCNKSTIKRNNLSITKKAITFFIIFLSIVLIMFSFGRAFASINDDKISDVEVSNSVKAIYDKDTKTISIENSYIKTDSDKQYVLDSIETNLLNDVNLGDSIWKINVNNKDVYDNKIPGVVEAKLNLNSNNEIKYDVSKFDENLVENLNGKQIAKVNFNIHADEKPVPVETYKMTFTANEHGSIDGAKELIVEKNCKYKVSDDGKLIFKNSKEEILSTLTPTPDSGYHYYYWAIDGKRVAVGQEISINSDLNFNVYFEANPEKISLKGTVGDKNLDPIENMHVMFFKTDGLKNNPFKATLITETFTDSNGQYTLDDIDQYTMGYIKFEYSLDDINLVCPDIMNPDTSQSQIAIDPAPAMPSSKIYGYVKDIDNNIVSDVNVVCSMNIDNNDYLFNTFSDENGLYSFNVYANYDYEIKANKENYVFANFSYLALDENKIVQHNIEASKIDQCVYFEGYTSTENGNINNCEIRFICNDESYFSTWPDKNGYYKLQCFPNKKGVYKAIFFDTQLVFMCNKTSPSKPGDIIKVSPVFTEVKASLDLKGGQVDDSDIPQGWFYSSAEKLYLKYFAKGTELSLIPGEWDNVTIIGAQQDKKITSWTYQPEAETLESDTNITANWERVYMPKAVITTDNNNQDDKMVFYYDDIDHSTDTHFKTVFEVVNTLSSSSDIKKCLPRWLKRDKSLVQPKHVIFDSSFSKWEGLLRMSNWFYNMQIETFEGFENINTKNLSEVSSLFFNNNKLKSLDLSKFNTSNVKNFNEMFSDCRYIKNIYLGGKFSTENATSIAGLFSNCESITEIDLSNLNTKNVENLGGLFLNCASLEGLNVSNFDTSNVTNMGSVFMGCSNLKSLDISSWTTDKVLYTVSMFEDCILLKKINLPKFLKNSLKDISRMFYKCSNLKDIDISNFNTSNVENFSYLFAECSNISNLDLSNFDTSNAAYFTAMFMNCSIIKSLKINNFNTIKAVSMVSLFEGCVSLLDVDLSHINTSNVGLFCSMFKNCKNLEHIDLSNFKTNIATDFSHMFEECSSLKSIDVSNFNTPLLNNVRDMFLGCSSLTNIDLSSFDTSKLRDMSGLFGRCSSLTSYNISSFDTSKVTHMGGLFYECKSLSKIDLTNIYTHNVTDIQYMFSGCSGITSLDISKLDTSKVEYFSGMFKGCTSLQKLNLSNFNTSSATEMDKMFQDCNSLIDLDLSSFDTSKVEVMDYLFCGCSSLKSVNLKSFNTYSLGYITYMFYNCSSLRTLDLTNFDVSQVSEMSYAFSGCTSLISLDLSSWVTSSIPDVDNLFSGDSSLQELNLENFSIDTTSKYSNLFKDCNSLSKFTIGENWKVSMGDCGLSYKSWKNEKGEIFAPEEIPEKSGYGTFTKA